jgi:hypothetical protein
LYLSKADSKRLLKDCGFIGATMIKVKAVIKIFTLIVVPCLFSACAEFKEAGRSVGNTTRNVTTDIGHGSRETFHVIGKGTKRVVKSITQDTD